jgi:hypothetical protein
MAEETKYGSPTPPGQNRGLECAQFETWLSEAIDNADAGDGQVNPGLAKKDRESFDAHRRVCGVCGPLFAEVQAGRQWLRSLEAVEPPVHMVHNILAATSGVFSARSETATAGRRATPFGERMRERWDSFFAPVAAFVRQPRFVMSFGMIFFSFSLALSAAGVKASDVAKVNLRPSALRHAYNDAQIKAVQYYDNIRFVYEIESKLRELKRANVPAEPAPQQPKDNRKNTSGQPDQRQDRNYSQEYDQPVLAALRTGAPIMEVLHDGVGDAPDEATVTTNRRFV